MAGLWYEEFEVGRVFKHEIRRTVTETDNVLFTTLTHNPAAIHLDAEYCKTTPFGRPLVNSCWTLGFMTGVTVGDTTLGTTIANLGMSEVKFPAPLFEGDTVSATTEVVAKRESKSRPDAGLVEFLHRAFKQDGTLVAECRRTALMRRRPQSTVAV